jgi:NAD-dependent deacetylase sirtuin 4
MNVLGMCEMAPPALLCFSFLCGCLTSLVCFFEVQFYGCNHCVRAALEKGAPVAIVNIGPTRADDIATLKIEAQSGEVVNLITNYMHLTFTGFIAWIDPTLFP